MIRLFHFNHGHKGCIPGSVFDLLPIPVLPGPEYAEAHEGLKEAFPGGLSLFGYRHLFGDESLLAVPESKLKLEWECELVRRKFFRQKQSRYQGFFALASLGEAIAFREETKKKSGISGSIWLIEAERIHHRGDMRLLTPERCDEALLCDYWQGVPLEGGIPTWGCMVVSPVKMLRCIYSDGASGTSPPWRLR